MSDIAAPGPARPAFSPIVVLAMVLAGVFSFSAFLVLSAFAPDLRGGSDGGAHALSKSAVGFAGVVRLLRAEGEDVEISRNQGADRDPAWRLLVLTPDANPGKDELAALTARGPTLIVAPKWLTTPDPLSPGWVNQTGLIDPQPIQSMLASASANVTVVRRALNAPAHLSGPFGVAETGPIQQLQVFLPGKGLDVVVSDAQGGAVLAASPDRKLFFLSDPDLLNTHGLADLATAKIANHILHGLRPGGGPIAFDVSLNGFGAPRSLLKLAFSPPFLGATLCLAAVGLLIGLHALTRFGAPVAAGRALAFGKRALADNSAALIKMARREPRMAGRYLDLSRAAVVRALGAGRVPAPELDAFLDRLAEKSGVEQRLSKLVPEAAAVKTRADLTRVAQSLYQWRMEMTGERR